MKIKIITHPRARRQSTILYSEYLFDNIIAPSDYTREIYGPTLVDYNSNRFKLNHAHEKDFMIIHNSIKTFSEQYNNDKKKRGVRYVNNR